MGKFQFMFFSIIFLLISCNSSRREYQKNSFSQVKNGMTKDDVIEILGLPDTIYYGIVDSSEYEFIYFIYQRGLRERFCARLRDPAFIINVIK
jgi:hypothetical protein